VGHAPLYRSGLAMVRQLPGRGVVRHDIYGRRRAPRSPATGPRYRREADGSLYCRHGIILYGVGCATCDGEAPGTADNPRFAEAAHAPDAQDEAFAMSCDRHFNPARATQTPAGLVKLARQIIEVVEWAT
jgi:hypothetical protein